MKLAPLLAQYLYLHKRLSLPGIGTFLLDGSLFAEKEPVKQGKPVNIEGISFQNDTTIKEAPELIDYIISQTRKIKALAAADLDSYLEQAKQFLNIGKPFLFEGIGSLSKMKSGEYSFTPRQVMPESLKNYPIKEISGASSTEESSTDYKKIFYPGKAKINWKRIAGMLLLLAGIGLAIWGGYTMYKKTKENDSKTVLDETRENEKIPVDVNDTVQHQQDSIAEVTKTVLSPGNYKFILEISTVSRAFERFNRLKKFQWNVQMETKDSLSYKIFMQLPASVADTAKILDSLSRLSGKRVYIEQ